MRKLLLFFKPPFTAVRLPREASAPPESIVFRFVPRSDMLYVPGSGDGAQLENLVSVVSAYNYWRINKAGATLV